MSEENPTQDNKLIRAVPADPEPASVTTLYDAEAKNRFEFTVRSNGKKYDTAHVYNPIIDTRYMQWLREFKIKGNEENLDEQAREATVKLWDELIDKVEKINYPDGSDWKKLIDYREKIESMNQYLAVAIVEDDEPVEGERGLGAANVTRIVKTEAWFNGEVLQQEHELVFDIFEYQKKYSRIQAKRFKQETTRGLRRKPKIEYIPQDERFGELYDEMMISVGGFANANIPLRFKTTVVHYVFEELVEAKKSER